MSDLETSLPGRKLYGLSPKNMTPLEPKQIANFLGKLKALANCEGSPIGPLPNPAIPTTPLARPSRRKVGPQVNATLGAETMRPGFDPSVDCKDTTSCASSPLVDVRMKGLYGESPQVLLLHPGLGLPLHWPHALELARLHTADRHLAGL